MMTIRCRSLLIASMMALLVAPLDIRLASAADALPTTDEKSLIETLRSGEPAEKATACKQLAIYGSKECIAELAPLLSDPHLNSWARIALEAIPDPAADEVLRTAARSLRGMPLVGVLNSIGVRRDEAAVDLLQDKMQGNDPQLEEAAAIALGHIGTPAAAAALRPFLQSESRTLRGFVSEGCILCAERLNAAGHTDAARELYDAVREAKLSNPSLAEATHGAILTRGTAGIPLLIEQLNSQDKSLLQIGLSTARELKGPEVDAALSEEFSRATPELAALIIAAMADRPAPLVSPVVLQAAAEGAPTVRLAAVRLIGRAGDAAGVPVLLKIAATDDADLSQAALDALAGMPGEQVDKLLVDGLPTAEGKELRILVDLLGKRRVEATAALVKLLDSSDDALRAAALGALGETTDATGLPVLIAQALAPRNEADGATSLRALRAACVRMPDREACAAQLAAAMVQAPVATKAAIVEILGAMAGPTALSTIAAAVDGGDEQLREAGSRALGGWMSLDAAPVLLKMATDDPAEKYRTRALRGYIRLARQFAMPADERAAMCRHALAAAHRDEERKLVLAVLERYPTIESLTIAAEVGQKPALRDAATHSAEIIAAKMQDLSPAAVAQLALLDLHPVKIEIIKAEYGAGRKSKDVTDLVKRYVGVTPEIPLPGNYNDSFQGDPAPGVVKKLTLQYRVDGKAGEASFAENADLILPMPQ